MPNFIKIGEAVLDYNTRTGRMVTPICLPSVHIVESNWNVMAHGDAREEKWRGNKRMEWVTSKRHMTAEHRLARAVQTLQADVHSSAASSRLNWGPRWFKWTLSFHRKTKSGFCTCVITFQTQSKNVNPYSQGTGVSISKADDGKSHTHTHTIYSTV